MLIEQLTLTNILSFGPEPETVTFGPLTVLIGANGSGKSNLLEVIDLLRNAPSDLLKPIQEGGGISEWVWKGDKSKRASIEVIADTGFASTPSLRYGVSFSSVSGSQQIRDEHVAKAYPDKGQEGPLIYYRSRVGHAQISINGKLTDADPKQIDFDRSILSQRRDPVIYSELTDLAESFGGIRLYREWSIGRYTPPRLPQRADMPNKWLEPDATNLGLIMNRLRRDPDAKARFLNALKELYVGIDDFDVQIEGGSVQAFLQEGRFNIPATRLSDGTLRYLCLLAILCHPNPPPLVCIEEPELGLHPDIIRTVAKLLQEASERCQLIVTTHSDVLVDAMTATPEAIVVCEKHEGATKLHRLSAEEMAPWLEKYRLGELWTSGQIGGNRW